MSRRFHRGLVVGKFSPLHRGHEWVIEQALDECHEVVLLCYSNPELPGCSADRREAWLSTRFPGTRRLVVTDGRLQTLARPGEPPSRVPPNGADALVHRRFCGFLCQQVLGVTVDAVFTSEDYGDGFATELTRYFRERNPGAPAVRHVLVDRDRVRIPISGTRLRQDVHAHREWLAPEVYASFVERVCLLGAESTGKSTLAEALARAYATRHVPEYGREFWEQQSGRLVFEDLRHIAEIQVQREDAAALQARRYLFCDTSPLTTLCYSQFLFGRAETGLDQLAQRAYAVTLLCAPDFPLVQDGTRQTEAFRSRQHAWLLAELDRRGIPFQLLTGSLPERLQAVRNRLPAGA